MADELYDVDGDGRADLVAFAVEGYGTYLVPLTVLEPFLVAPNDPEEPSDGETPFGWGWQVPVVQWNTFHAAQQSRCVALGPVTARLDARHFPQAAPAPDAAPSPESHPSG